MQPFVMTPGGYHRQVIHNDADGTIVRIIWHPGSRTPKHNHGKSFGSILVVSGRIFEIRDGVKRYYAAGETILLPVGVEHIVGNDSTEDSKTLHTYSPELAMKKVPENETDIALLAQQP